jgi:hypothetical protein
MNPAEPGISSDGVAVPQVDNHDLALALADAARDLAAAQGAQATLEEACEQAVAVIAGCDWAGICEKQREGCAELLAASDASVRALHDLQYELDDGPCRSAVFEERILWSDDLTADKRWPRFGAAAVEWGVRSLASIQLYTRNSAVVMLHLYSASAGAFDEVTRDVAQIFGAHAATAVAGARDYADISRAGRASADRAAHRHPRRAPQADHRRGVRPARQDLPRPQHQDPRPRCASRRRRGRRQEAGTVTAVDQPAKPLVGPVVPCC